MVVRVVVVLAEQHHVAARHVRDQGAGRHGRRALAVEAQPAGGRAILGMQSGGKKDERDPGKRFHAPHCGVF